MNEYGTILTKTGEALIAQHLQEGGKLELVEFAVGDGGGAEYRPTPDMTALRGERWRGPVRAMSVSGENPNVIVIEAVVPAEVGGFTIREAGVFDAQGNLIGVMNTPQSEKVASTGGAFTEQQVQVYLTVSSTAAIELSVDSSTVYATKGELEAHNRDVGAHEAIREGAAAALRAHDADVEAHPAIWGALNRKVRCATLVVGTNLAGCTAGEVDFLCDGVDDQEEINAAIQALPEGGGKVVVREGTYNLTDSIVIDVNMVTLEGVGRSTTFLRMFEGEGINPGLVFITADQCIVQSMLLEGNIGEYSGNNCNGFYVEGSNNIIAQTICRNNNYGIYFARSNNTATNNMCYSNVQGIYAAQSNSVICGNTCVGSSLRGIDVRGSNNAVTGNTCRDNKIGIDVMGESNNITGNNCSNNTDGMHAQSNYNLVSGNICNRNSKNGINALGAYNSITSNMCNNNVICGLDIAGSNLLIATNCLLGNATAINNRGSNNTIENNKSS